MIPPCIITIIHRGKIKPMMVVLMITDATSMDYSSNPCKELELPV